MNIYKLLKPVLPALMVVSAAVFIAGCSSSSDDSARLVLHRQYLRSNRWHYRHMDRLF